MQFPHEYIRQKGLKNKTVFNSLAPFVAEVEIDWDNSVTLLKADYLGQISGTAQQCLNGKLVEAVEVVFHKWLKNIEPPVCVDITGFTDFDLTFLHHPEFEYEGHYYRKRGAKIKYSIDGHVRLFDVVPNHKQIMQREFNGLKLGFFI